RDVTALMHASLKGNDWLSKKFVEYLLRGVAGALVPHPKAILSLGMPPPDRYEAVFTSIYRARSGHVHAGTSMPASIDAMMGEWIDVRAHHVTMGRAFADDRWKSGDMPS